MSSDPIEVLRDMHGRLKTFEADYRHRIKGQDAADPLTNFNAGMAEGFRACASEVDNALASLSAPKPSSVNDNAVAVNEVAPVNDKPESVEVVWTDEQCLQFAAVAFRHAPKNLPTGVTLEDIRMAASTVYGLTAPPRPEASAPVGVEVLVERMRQAPSRLWRADLVGQQISVERMRDILAFALALQPAAVDEAMVERVTEAVVGWGTLPGDSPAEPEQVAELREVISAALAGQQQGGPQE